jgi:hypothetical protein
MAAFERVGLLGALALLPAACVANVSESGLPCPCSAAFVCCPGTNTCEETAAACGEHSAVKPEDGSPDHTYVISSFDVATETREGAAGEVETESADADAGWSDAAPDRSLGDAPSESSGDVMAEPQAESGPDARLDVSTDVDAGLDAPADTQDGSAREGGPYGCWSTPRKSRVLVIAYNPFLISQGKTMTAYQDVVSDPEFQSVRMSDLVRTTSHGLVNYDIVAYRELDAWPKQLAGAAPLDETSFLYGPPAGNFTDYDGGNADYADIFASQDICNYAAQNDVSEVWLWGTTGNFQQFGFDLVSYRFPGDVLPSRAPSADDFALYARLRRNLPDCGRTIVVLGFTYRIGYDPRVYTFRMEDNLSMSLRGIAATDGGTESIFQRFEHPWFDFPGDVQVGNAVFPPNGGLGKDADQAWDYYNFAAVQSGADDWYAYPALTGAKKAIDCTVWGCDGDGYQAWWQLHVPHAAGESSERGCNNWWKYVADIDGRLTPCSGTNCDPSYPVGRSCTSDAQCASHHCTCLSSRRVCTDSADAAGPACP